VAWGNVSLTVGEKREFWRLVGRGENGPGSSNRHGKEGKGATLHSSVSWERGKKGKQGGPTIAVTTGIGSNEEEGVKSAQCFKKGAL